MVKLQIYFLNIFHLSLFFLLHIVLSMHTHIQHTYIHMHAHMYIQFTVGQECKMSIIVGITFLVCNYFLRTDFRKWYYYVKYFFFIVLDIIMLISKQWLYQLVTINFRKYNCHWLYNN